LTASESYNTEVGGPEPLSKLILYHEAVQRAVELLRARIAQVNIMEKCKNSQNLNWTNKACFREELPVGNLGSKKLASTYSYFTKLVVFKILNCTDAKLFIPDPSVKVTVSYGKIEWYRNKHNVKSDELSRNNSFGIKSTINNK
jgi:hypothetical protein